jgi:hypothetical protein
MPQHQPSRQAVARTRPQRPRLREVGYQRQTDHARPASQEGEQAPKSNPCCLTICASSRHTRHQRRRVSGVGMTWHERSRGNTGTTRSGKLTREGYAEKVARGQVRAELHHTKASCCQQYHPGAQSRHWARSGAKQRIKLKLKQSGRACLILLGAPQRAAHVPLFIGAGMDVPPKYIVTCQDNVGGCQVSGGHDTHAVACRRME